MSTTTRAATEPIRAVLFDLDDTLYDRSTTFRRWAAWFVSERLGVNHSGERDTLVRAFVELDGDGYRPRSDLFGWISERFGAVVGTANELFRAYQADRHRFGTLADGARETLDELERLNIPFGIVTNGPPEQMDKVAAVGLNRSATCICISAIVGVNKPDPQIFLTALELLGAKAHETLFVGDNPANDIAGARGVGMRTGWLRHGREWPVDIGDPPDLVIDSLEELLPLIARG